MTLDDDAAGQIAVIGLAGRFPGAATIDQFWANLTGGIESLTTFPTAHPVDHVPTAGVLEAADQFDAAFFGCSPAEATILDPQHRLFLETAWEALEDAGCDPSSPPGAIGIYGGGSETGYLEWLRARRDRLPAVSDFQLKVATGLDFLTTRVAYKLGLHGPAVTVQTACSTSLVAIHLAAQALLAGECDVALAGGVTATIRPEPSDYDEGGIVSRDGHCRAFDAEAAGTVTGAGVGIVALKRLTDAIADGDQIRAVLLGSAINNDAALKVGFAAPSVDGQAQVIRAAQLVAQVGADSIGYVEAHGTATPLGDPIEVAALTKAFRDTTDRQGFCHLGSVKTNIGHADAAAGVAGFIKAVLAVQHGLIPPTLHYRHPNPQLDLDQSPFQVTTSLTPWPATGTPRRAAVSSFGIGGTNAHVILQQPPSRPAADQVPSPQLLVLSARTRPALEAATARLADALDRRPDLPLPEVAWTLQTGRQPLKYRRAVVATTHDDAVGALRGTRPDLVVNARREPRRRPVVFLFPGQGGQHVGMARELSETQPVFRAELDAVCELAAPLLGLDLRQILFPDMSEPAATENAGRQLRRMSIGQPAVFAVEYALARLWMAWGVTPAGVVGHSLGAYAAACIADVLPLPAALRLVITRGGLLESLPAGAMLAVPLGEDAARPLLGNELSLAAVNGPAQTVISGPVRHIDDLQARLGQRGVDARRLNISTAAHSSLVDQAMAEFEAAVARQTLGEPTLPFLSDLTGDWAQPGQLTAPEYWTAHLRHTVRFSDALTALAGAPDSVLLEVGPGRTLATLARQHPALGGGPEVVSSLGHPADTQSDVSALVTATGRLWLDGAALEWTQLHAGRRPAKVSLPTYPFQRRSYSLDVGEDDAADRTAGDDPDSAPDAERTPTQRAIARLFIRVLGVRTVSGGDSFFDLGGDSLIAAKLVALAAEVCSVQLSAGAIYDHPTVAALAAHVDALTASRSGAVQPANESDHPRRGEQPGRWLACRTRRPDAPLRLYCFPHSGGSAGEYVRWADGLPDIEVLGLQLPGRGARLHEPGYTRMDALVAAITAAVTFEPPYALFGHSLGALVAYEAARALIRAGRPAPGRLVLSACPAPHLPRGGPELHRLPDAELARWISTEYGSLPAGIADDSELAQTVLPGHRADFELVETYRHDLGRPLDVPFTVLGGLSDDLESAELTAWAAHTTRGFDLELLPGDHFYLRERTADLMRLLNDRLQLRPASAA